MNQHIMNITGTTAGINRFDAEGAWGGASWDGVLNVGMYLFKEFNNSKKWKHFVIKEYDSEWKNIARQEMKQITEHLSPFSWFRDIQHIGSTSIPGMAAKPLVDLLLGCDKLASLEEVSSQLVSLGFEKLYHYKPTRFLCKDSPDFGVSVCIVEYQDAYWRTRILFRDYFADHLEEIATYSNLKKNLLSKSISFEKYCEGKQAYIYNILLKQGVTIEDAEIGNVFYKNPTDMSILMPVTRHFNVGSNEKTIDDEENRSRLSKLCA